MWVQSLGLEYSLEEGMATHSIHKINVSYLFDVNCTLKMRPLLPLLFLFPLS